MVKDDNESMGLGRSQEAAWKSAREELIGHSSGRQTPKSAPGTVGGPSGKKETHGIYFCPMEWRGKAGGQRDGVGGSRDGRLLIAAIVNGRAEVCVLGSASIRAESSRVGDRGGKGGPGGWLPEFGCGRDGLQSMTALVNSRAVVPPPRLGFAAWGRCGP